LTGEVFQLFKR